MYEYLAFLNIALRRHIECVHKNQYKIWVLVLYQTFKKPMFHENKKNHKCDLWDYLAFQHCDLRSHIECVHEKLKPHQYNICQKSFGLKQGFPTFYLLCPPKSKIINVGSPREKLASPNQEILKKIWGRHSVYPS